MDFLVDIEGTARPPGYAEADHARVRRACREVRHRTGYRAWYNFNTRQIGFGFYRGGDPMECLGVPMFRDDGSPARFGCDETWDTDQIVHALQAGKRSIKDKLRIARARQTEHMKEVVAKRKAAARAMGDAAQERFEELQRNKHTVAVSGRKGN